MQSIENIPIDQSIIDKTRCIHDYACLSDRSHCAVEVFVDRDVRLVRCLAEASCHYKTYHANSYVCTCPVNREYFTKVNS